MSVVALLSDLKARGVTLSVNNEKLGIKAPTGAIDDALKSRLKTHKDELITLLSATSGTGQTTIKKVSRQQYLPLSFAQQQIWVLAQLQPGSASYHITTAFELEGQLDRNALQKSLDALIWRHEILRTVYLGHEAYSQSESLALESLDKNKTGQPQQRVLPPESLKVETFSAADIHLDETSGSLNRWLVEQASRPFDLRSDPVLRVSLLSLSDNSFILQWVFHHIAVDAWSLGILMREFTQLYQAACHAPELSLSGLVNQMEPLPVQYADFASWQRTQIQSETWQKQLRYWTGQLVGTEQEPQPILDFPTDYRRPTAKTWRGERVSFALEPQLAHKIQCLNDNGIMTPFVLILGCFQTLLQQYSGQKDIRVGVPNANRSRADVQNLVGFFVNTLVMKAEFFEGQTVAEFFKQIHKQHLAAMQNKDIPFEMLVDKLLSHRDMDTTPLFQVMFNFLQKEPLQSSLQLPALVAKPLDIQQGLTKFDLTLTIEAHQSRQPKEPAQYHGTFEYNTDLYSPARIQMLARHFQHLLEQLVMALDAQPHVMLQDISALTEKDKRTQLVDWNSTHLAVDFSQDPLARFEAQVEKTPDNIALVTSEIQENGTGSAEKFSYAELNLKANQLAHCLVELGIKQNDLVAVCMERNACLLMALLAVHKAGGAYLPLDPQYPLQRRRTIIQHAKPSLILTQHQLQQHVAASLQDAQDYQDDQEGETQSNSLHKGTGEPICDEREQQQFNIPWLSLPDDNDAVSHWQSSNGKRFNAMNFDCGNLCSHGTQNIHNKQCHQDLLAYTLYTSGSTGTPKGVQVSRRAFTNFLCGMQQIIPLTENDNLLAVTTISFDIAGLELFLPLINGATVVLATSEQAAAPRQLQALIKQQEITVMQATPVSWQMLLENPSREYPDCLKDLKVLCGGEALSAKLATGLLEGGAQLLNLYGPTETTVWSSYNWIRQPSSGPAPIGKPIANTQCYVLNEAMQLLPPGAVGELYIGGEGLAEGYLHRADLTEKVFVANPFSNAAGERLYRTGDKVRYGLDGCMEYLGRNDHQVKIRGFRIELGEIESVLLQQKSVKEAVVMARPGSDNAPILMAWVIPEKSKMTDENLLIEELKAALKQTLPAYMQPMFWYVLDIFPRTANGKTDRKALPEYMTAASAPSYTPPGTTFESELCDIWQSILNLERVGIDDNFFDIGGHSLLAIRLMRILEERGYRLPWTAIFQKNTIRELANATEDDVASLMYPLRVAPASNPDLSLFCIHHIGGHTLQYQTLASNLSAEIPVYSIQSFEWLQQDSDALSVRSMANDYVAEIQAVKPIGPYCLLGWSFGGIIAVEISRILEQQGEEVSFLGLIDSSLGTIEPDNSQDVLHVFLELAGITKTEMTSITDMEAIENLAQQALTTKGEDSLISMIEQVVERQIFPIRMDKDYLLIRAKHLVRYYELLNEHNDFLKGHPAAIRTSPHIWWASNEPMDIREIITAGSEENVPTRWADYCQSIAGQYALKGEHHSIILDEKLHQQIEERILRRERFE